MILLLIITFAGGITLHPMSSMDACKRAAEQVMQGNAPPRTYPDCRYGNCINVARAQCLDGGER